MQEFGSLWSQKDEFFLIENYSTNGVKFCSEKLKRTENSIKHKVKKLGLSVNEFTKSRLQRKYKKEDMEIAVKNSLCYADVCRYFNLKPQSGNYTNFKKLIKEYEIDIKHFLRSGELSSLRNKFIDFTKKDINEYFCENSKTDRKHIKSIIYKNDLKIIKCDECGQSENWRGKKISLILDHINGINNDNRLKNLRLLCPNCNATLDTHCGKNKRKLKKTNIKITRIPPKNNLLVDFEKLKYYSKIGEKYGVSDNAVRKWAKKYEII